MPSCYDAFEYAQYIDAPMLIIQSPYDEWGLGYQVEATCYSGMHPPYSLQNCNKTAIEDIEKYRRTAI